MKLYSIVDGYIDYLRSKHVHVYSNKEIERVHTRKYIGVVIIMHGHNYYIPLSSPKDSDYDIVDGVKTIKKDSFTVFRIKTLESNGEYSLKGTIRFQYMIPVPESELNPYNPDYEDDSYKDLIECEMIYIRKNKKRIMDRAKLIYNNKTTETRSRYMRNAWILLTWKKCAANGQITSHDNPDLISNRQVRRPAFCYVMSSNKKYPQAKPVSLSQ